MAHAEVCPVCNGKGELPADKNNPDFPTKTCYGCDTGKGWVTVQDEKPAPFVVPGYLADIQRDPLTHLPLSETIIGGTSGCTTSEDLN